MYTEATLCTYDPSAPCEIDRFSTTLMSVCSVMGIHVVSYPQLALCHTHNCLDEQCVDYSQRIQAVRQVFK